MNKSIYFSLTIIYFIISLSIIILVESIYLNIDYETINYIFLGLFIFNYLIIYSLGGPLSIYGLFLLTSAVFIYGKVISSIFTSKVNIEEITFFTVEKISNIDMLNLLACINLILASISLGYVLNIIIEKRKRLKLIEYSFNRIPLKGIILIIVFCISPYIINGLITVIQNGYLSFYTNNLELLETGSFLPTLYSFGITISIVFLSIAIQQQKNNYIKLFFLILLINAILLTIIGQRGPIVSFFLFYLWYRNKYIKKIKLSYLFILLFIMIIFSQTTLIFRDDYNNVDKSILDNYLLFFSQQGLTLQVVYLTKYIHEYPLYLIMQNFIPGSIFIYKQLFPHIELYNSSSALLSSIINSNLYKSGAGVGWSVYADILLLSNRNPILIILFSFILGYIISISENFKNNYNIIITCISVIFAFRIGFLPRAGLNGIFPLIIYSIIIVSILKRRIKK
ncbi:oligosaccharide repeat unit polymerase [Providencia rettgeri]|uniref:O-antigen polymerase n=1 Tax=Providencia rettgeri TaxID=587 RepID=UPI001B36F492|nr:O-antigen polymerase [Providencia rettgeri]EMC8780757.1 oligosaccharide repeat unit polymerase [Providencia rettgeri]MBQ0397790.1 oligosaccharide repeat unit polymerase [Providencia rettgeri]